jgi:hypothetical protein
MSPYEKGTDIWFRYASEDDVRAWCELIKAKLPSAIDRFITSGNLSKDARELLDEFGSGAS